MKDKTKRSTRKKTPKLTTALHKGNLSCCLQSLTAANLIEFFYDLRIHVHYWMGDPTEERIGEIRRDLPILDRFIDFDTVRERLECLELFERSGIGVSLTRFLPELTAVLDATANMIHQLPSGVEKAECWLRPIAKHAAADADVEAAVYFASRGRLDIIGTNDLRDSWHAAVCYAIERGCPGGQLPAGILERARSKTVSLAEATKVLGLNGSLPRFFAFRDEEEDFIDAAMFRAVDFFGITGFEPWLRSSITELSVGPQCGIDHACASWVLFYWCRSDLALQMADRNGLEAWLWALINGPLERDRPWVLFNPDRGAPQFLDYIPIAAVIPFIWHRIQPANMKPDILARACEFLFQTQMQCGGWPTHTKEGEPCLMATCFAVHGLVAHKPTGWEQAVSRAAQWIMSEQGDLGGWFIEGGPPVMITVLALDSLELAKGGDKVTFGMPLTGAQARVSSGIQSVADDVCEPVYDFSSEDWYLPAVPSFTSANLRRSHNAARPQVALVVATDIELLQTLRVLTPLSRRHRLWKVVRGCDTFYLGRFGAFDAVITLSGLGSQGPAGSTLCVDAVIREWKPKVVILLGIAFGANRRKHLPADVLVAESLIPYENQRVGDPVFFRNPVPPSSFSLLNRFRHALDWRFTRPDGSRCMRHIGPLLSGEKLVDNRAFKESLLNQYPSAIGGEMEGAGLWGAAQRADKKWIIVKGVCDWGDGRKHDAFHPMAAAAAVSLCLHVLSDEHTLDGM